MHVMLVYACFMKVKKHVFMFFYLQINVFNIYVSNEKELLTTHYLV